MDSVCLFSVALIFALPGELFHPGIFVLFLGLKFPAYAHGLCSPVSALVRGVIGIKCAGPKNL
jgi:hypothetical protein